MVYSMRLDMRQSGINWKGSEMCKIISWYPLYPTISWIFLSGTHVSGWGQKQRWKRAEGVGVGKTKQY